MVPATSGLEAPLRPAQVRAQRTDNQGVDRVTLKYVATMIACAVVGFFPFVRETRVPLLGLFDFGMHELGHLLFIWAGETVHFLAGSVFQVIVPAGLAVYFWWFRGDRASAAFLGAWTGASLWDVSVYIADAPFERLLLIGGDHDWAFLLHKYDIMSSAGPLASGVQWAGGLAIVVSIGIAAAGPWLEEHAGRNERLPIRLQSAAGAADTPNDPWD